MISFHSTDFLGVSQEPPQALLPTCLVDLWCSQSLSPDWSGQLGQRQPAGRRNKDPGLGYLGNGQYFSPISTLSDPPLQRWVRPCNPHFYCALLHWDLLLPIPVGITPAGRITCLHRVPTKSSVQSASTYRASLLAGPYLFLFFNIYLAVPSLSCSTWDL